MPENTEKKGIAEKIAEAILTVGLALVPSIEKISTAVAEMMIVKAKTDAQVAEVEGRVSILTAQTELRRMELVSPIETETAVAEAKVKLAKVNKELVKLQAEERAFNGATGKTQEGRV